MSFTRAGKYVLSLLVVYCIYEIQCSEIPYDTVVCFGDSMSDTGNVYNLTSFKYPAAPYYLGRFSNGPVWIEKLNISNLINYAYGSATSDNNLVQGVTAFNTVVPGVRQQIMIYKNMTDLTKINFARAIYAVWVDGNDYYFNSALSPSTVVNSIINGIKDLINIGATNFLIVNQSPLQAFPSLIPLNMSDYLLSLSLIHNSNLSNSIQTLQSNYTNLSFYLFDVYSLISNILLNSSAYGINNTQNCWYTFTNATIPLCTTPDSYLFIDEYHFTTHVHQIIADNAKQLLVTSSDGTMKSSYSIIFILSFFILIKY